MLTAASKVKYILKWQKNNPEKVKEYAKRTYDKNREKILAYQKARRTDEKNKKYQKEYNKMWKKKNRDKVNENRRKNYQKNKEMLRERRLMSKIELMNADQKSQIIEWLDTTLMDGVQQKKYLSLSDIDEQAEITKAFQLILNRTSIETEEFQIYDSPNYQIIIEEIDEYFMRRVEHGQLHR